MSSNGVPRSSAIFIAMVLCALSAAVVSSITAALIKHDVELTNSLFATSTMRDLDYTAARVESVVSQLTANNVTSCADSHEVLKEYVFKYPGISDIGIYTPDGLACTAMTKVFAAPLADPGPSFKTLRGDYVWNNRFLQSKNTGSTFIAYRQGVYFFAIEPFSIHRFPPPASNWEITYGNGVDSIHADGVEGLAQSLGSWSKGLAVEECSSAYSYCVTIFMSWDNILKSRVKHIVVGVLAMGLLAFLLCAWSSRHLSSLVGSKSRTLKALRSKAFAPAYQPIVDMGTESIVGCEVLARLKDNYGDLSPLEFISVIANLGKHQEFTEMMFDLAYDGIKDLDWLHREPFKLSFNLYPENLNYRTVVFFKSHPALRDKRFQICLEITEDTSVSDAIYIKTVNELKDMGIELSVDDFGSGYGNLKRIELAQLDYLKIDRSLVSHLTTQTLDTSLTSFVPLIAKKMGLKTVAEGIETKENAEAIKMLGIQYGQGWFYGKPMPAEEFIAQSANWKSYPLTARPNWQLLGNKSSSK